MEGYKITNIIARIVYNKNMILDKNVLLSKNTQYVQNGTLEKPYVID